MRFAYEGPPIVLEEGIPQRQVSSVEIISKTREKLLERFAGVFSENEFLDLPDHRPGVDLDIELIGDKAPPFGPIYSLSQEEEELQDTR